MQVVHKGQNSIALTARSSASYDQQPHLASVVEHGVSYQQNTEQQSLNNISQQQLAAKLDSRSRQLKAARQNQDLLGVERGTDHRQHSLSQPSLPT